MKWVILFLSFCTIAQAENIRYPYVHEIEGSVQHTDKDDKTSELKKLDILREKAILHADSKARVHIKLSEFTSIKVFGPFDLTVPGIAIEDGRADLLTLTKGAIYYSCQKNCQHRIDTPLSSQTLSESEVVFYYDPNIPLVNVKVFQGLMYFKGLDNESGIEVKSGQDVSFKGELENGKPTYDVLLKGRKVARGDLTKLSEITAEDKALYTQEIKKEVKKKAVDKKTLNATCKKPLGQFNQCQWVCMEKNKNGKSCGACIRKRCDANGNWSDDTPVYGDLNKCKAHVVVKSCDY